MLSKKRIKGIIALLFIILGWSCLGIGYAIECPHPCNSTIFVSGLVLIFIGVVMLWLIRVTLK